MENCFNKIMYKIKSYRQEIEEKNCLESCETTIENLTYELNSNFMDAYLFPRFLYNIIRESEKSDSVIIA